MTLVVSPETIEQRFKSILSNRVGQIFLKIYSSVRVYSENFRIILLAFFLSVISQTTSVILMALTGYFIVGIEIDWAAFFFAVPLGFIAMAIPIAPAGIGVGQAVMFFLFSVVIGQESTLGPTVMTAFQIALFFASLPGIYFYVKNRPVAPEAANA